MTGAPEKKSPEKQSPGNNTLNQNIIANQHNYIQLNETRISQEEIQKLSPERQAQIKALLKS
jgi:hypothetical protein